MLVGGKQVDKENLWDALYKLKPGIEFAISNDIMNGLKNNLVKEQPKAPAKGENFQGNQR